MTNIIRAILALAGGVPIALVAARLLPITWPSDYMGIVFGAAIAGVIARKHPWLVGGLVGAAVAASFLFVLVDIVHTYSESFWRKPTGELDLHLEFFMHATMFVVAGAVASGTAHSIARRFHRRAGIYVWRGSPRRHGFHWWNRFRLP